MDPGFMAIHVAALILAILALTLGDQALHLCGISVILMIGLSLSIRARRRPEYAVFKMRRRARRLKHGRLSIHLPRLDGQGGDMRVQGVIVHVIEMHHDEILVRLDSPLEIGRRRWDLVALLPSRSGASFTTLLDEGRMPVRVVLVGPAYLSLTRGNLFADRAVRRDPPVGLGSGFAVLVPSEP